VNELVHGEVSWGLCLVGLVVGLFAFAVGVTTVFFFGIGPKLLPSCEV